MKIKLLLLGSLFLLANFCEKSELPRHEVSLENETFVYLHFKTEKKCLEAQPSDFFINCHSEISFFEDGVAEIILTDIIWRGAYDVIGKKILLTFNDNEEIPKETLVFQIINDSKIKNLEDNTIWKKLKGNSIWD